MKTGSFRFSVWLSRETVSHLNTIAQTEKVSRGELIRRAVLEYVERSRPGAYSLRRVAETVEYIQLCLQHHLIHDNADKHDHIVELLEERMDEFHGR